MRTIVRALQDASALHIGVKRVLYWQHLFTHYRAVTRQILLTTVVSRLRSKLVSDGELRRDLSDAERILIGDWDSVSVRRTKNRERALEVVERWENLSRMNRRDDIKSSVSMNQVVEEMNIDYKTAERVLEFVDEMTNGKIEFSEEDNALAQFDELVIDLDDI